jgi:hypothetical protein
MESVPNKSKDPTPWEAVAIAGDLILTVIVLTTVFAFGGRWVDVTLHTGYVFTIIGFVLLILIGYRVLLRKAEKMKKKLGIDNQENKTPKADSQKPEVDS